MERADFVPPLSAARSCPELELSDLSGESALSTSGSVRYASPACALRIMFSLVIESFRFPSPTTRAPLFFTNYKTLYKKVAPLVKKNEVARHAASIYKASIRLRGAIRSGLRLRSCGL